MGIILSIVGWIVGLLFKKPAGPSSEAVQARAAGSAETALKTEQVTNEAVQRAAENRDSAVRATATDSGLREYEAHDPNNRDA